MASQRRTDKDDEVLMKILQPTTIYPFGVGYIQKTYNEENTCKDLITY